MPICTWSEDYVSGVSDVDAQHKTLFRIINAFTIDENENMPTSVFLAFLDFLKAYCDSHFALEEEMMTQYNYPLKEYHVNIHESLKKTVGELREKIVENNLDKPFSSIIAAITEWLNNHIPRDDLAFFGYCKNKENNSINEDFVGRECDILTMNNDLLGSGKVDSVEANNVILSYQKSESIVMRPNDTLKVSTYNSNGEHQVFVAKIYQVEDGIIRLFGATLSPTIHNRKHFRVPTKLPASLYIEDNFYVIIISDISAGGLRIESTCEMEVGDKIRVRFMLENNHFSEYCRIMRAEKGEGFQNIYGVQFISMTNSNIEKINSFIFNSHALTLNRSETSYARHICLS